jgi:hypothetical protein
MKNIELNGIKYNVNDDEFLRIETQEYCNLKIYDNIPMFERIVSLLGKLSYCLSDKYETNLFIQQTTHGGFIPINCRNEYNNIYLLNTSKEQENNITTNINNFEIKNINFNYKNCNENRNNIMFCDVYDTKLMNNEFIDILIFKKDIHNNLKDDFNHKYVLSNSEYTICLKNNTLFEEYFKYYLNKNELNYDNLINVCIMVKNGGDQFEEMLIKNLSIIDKWTILDTGSSDNTIDIINKVLVGNKDGNLYQEPFINFRDSRNRLLELAGKDCKFNIILDDTYVVEGNLRDFLNDVRGDQRTSSFTIFIRDDDNISYGSNRIVKSQYELKYIHKIHEVITDNNNVNITIPEDVAHINDKDYDYMKTRSDDRKELDFKLLFEELEENPFEPRTYYYLGQTYKLVKDYENAFKYYMKRSEFENSGFRQELVNALFEAGRIANFQLNKPWDFCKKIYEKCYQEDTKRPDALYLIASHYYLNNDFVNAHKYLKKSFKIGFPTHTQYSLKPTFSYHFIPKLLTRACYHVKDYEMGESASLYFIKNNNENSYDYKEILSWYAIFSKLNKFSRCNRNKPDLVLPEKPLFIFVANGGFSSWCGSTLEKSGIGGSETYIIEMARYIQKNGVFNTVVFCNTPDKQDEIFENTLYTHLDNYCKFISKTQINTCLVSRYSEYLPVTFEGLVENVYLVVHDLSPSGIVIPMNNKLKNIFCLTEWHASYFSKIFPQLKSITVPFYHGQSFDTNLKQEKIPFKFIYSSFPNRGLLHLLEIWPEIYTKEPKSTLHIYCNLDQEWVNKVEPEKIIKIKVLLNLYNTRKYNLGIYSHGWVNKNVLQESWKTSDFWVYPCTFEETFCLTALECAISKTLAITNNLAGLENTVSDRGVVVLGDPSTDEWKETVLKEIFFYLDSKNKKMKDDLINKNYEWAINLTWEKRANKMLDDFVLKNKYEYLNVNDWTHDNRDKQDIKTNIINYFNDNYKNNEEIKILEIGCHTGTSLISFVNSIDNSIGLGTDDWDDNIKKIFIKNTINNCNNNKISYTNYNINFTLINLIKNNNKFDFIFLQNIAFIQDIYLYLNYSMELMNLNGVIGISKNIINVSKDVTEDIFDSEINIFIKKNMNHLKLICNNKNEILFLFY